MAINSKEGADQGETVSELAGATIRTGRKERFMKSTDILRIERTDWNEHTYIIRWQMTNLCNYYCDFCIQGRRERHIEQAKKESVQIREKICSNLIAYIEKELNGRANTLYLYLVGGDCPKTNEAMTR